jgi:DNA-binding transcriptional regulator YiaG
MLSESIANNEFWKLQKLTGLTNKECAEYLGTNIRTICRWRVNNPKAPKSVFIALSHYQK